MDDKQPQRRHYRHRTYIVYLEKTDEIVATGTARQCAEQIGLAMTSWYSYRTRQNSGKLKYYIYRDDED